MLKIIRYLKPFTVFILMIVLLLFLQAICDLSLPDYTSHIVNIGIQQKGIENAVPEIIRESQFEKLKFFVDEKFNIANENLTKTTLFINRLMSSMMPAMMLIMNGITLLIVWVGTHQVDAGKMQVGNMMAFIQYAMQIIMAFLMISMVSILFPRASVSAQRLAEVLDTKLSIRLHFIIVNLK